MRISDIIWKEQIVEKLASKHGVEIFEAEDVFHSRPVFRKIKKGRVRGEHVYAGLAQIAGGRYLVVYFIYKRNGVALPISARDMSPAERTYYEKHRSKR